MDGTIKSDGESRIYQQFDPFGYLLLKCSLVSTDSQDSLRLGILAELLSTFRLCLNDNNTCVIHVSLNALRILLPFSIN
ncbi:unnamed protein product [Rotaria sordida]|uniref:Uncharacterized protein n=1 Tax=Rotaria sordida TaxID=392033 RepID=A0A815EQY8_9BILA|nr:unnamed protein product [Rotaria sordida]CAF3819637.1 unnamed protein product [Rotaria sordida]